jgi:hypothetical protein
VRFCDVEVSGKDGQTHAVTLSAESLFHAAASAMNDWSRLWWWSKESIITVRAGEQVWRVRAQRVVDWEFTRRNAERRRREKA